MYYVHVIKLEKAGLRARNSFANKCEEKSYWHTGLQ